MAAEQLDPVIRSLRGVLGLDGVGPTDAELLGRFAGNRDPAAFEELVRRHGPLVMGACRRVLGNSADADDVFQATFLVFARRAAVIRKRDSVGSWLYGVALRIARRLRTQAAVRRRRETKGALRIERPAMSENSADQASFRELGTILDEELERLPAVCRVAIVACHLEGQSTIAAAHQLGIPSSTLKRRLERGRELLRQRLLRRGVELSTVALAVILGEQSRIRAESSLIQATVAAALQFAASGTAAVSTRAAALAATALRTMVIAKVKMGVFAVAMASLLGYAGVLAVPDSPQPVLRQPKEPEREIVQQLAHKDQHGDEIPAGAIARLGMVRWRHDRPVGFAAFRPDGKSVVTVGDDMTIRIWEYPSGKETRRIDLPPAPHRAVSPDFHVTHFGAADMASDGKTVATSMHWPEIRLFDVDSGKELPKLRTAEKITVCSLSFSGDGQRLAALNDKGTVFIWNWAQGKLLNKFAGVGDSGLGFRRIAYSSDGKRIAAFDDRNPRILPLGFTQSLKLWNAETGAEIGAVAKSADIGRHHLSPAFSPDSQTLAFSTAVTKKIAFFDAAAGKEIRTIATDGFPANTLVFSKDGARIYARAHRDTLVKEWDVASGQYLRDLGASRKSMDAIYNYFPYEALIGDRLSLSPDGRTLVLAGADNCPVFLDIASGKEMSTASDHAKVIVDVRFSPDGKRLWTQDVLPSIRQWDAGRGNSLGTIDLPDRPFQIVSSPDGKVFASASHETRAEQGLNFVDAATGKVLGKPARTFASWEFIHMTFTGDGKCLAIHSPPGAIVLPIGVRFPPEPNIEIYEVPSGRLLQTLRTGAETGSLIQQNYRDHSGLRNMIVSPDGKSLASYADATSLVLWDLATGKRRGSINLSPRVSNVNAPFFPIGVIGSFVRPVQSGVFSADGRCMALDFKDGTAVVFELATAQARRVYGRQLSLLSKEHELSFGGTEILNSAEPKMGPRLAYSPDDKTLVYAGPDLMLRLWDVATGLELAAFRGHTAPMTAVAFAPDGKTVASAGWDTTALIWDLSKLPRPAATIKKLEPGEWTANWELLAADDASKGFDAIIALTASPKEAVALVEERIKPVTPIEPERLDRLIVDLASTEFKVREQANGELLKLGELAVPALDKALAGNPALETQRRLEAIRHQSDPITMILKGERLRAYRAVEVLERIGTTESRRLLTSYASGVPGALLTRSAEAALKRMAVP